MKLTVRTKILGTCGILLGAMAIARALGSATDLARAAANGAASNRASPDAAS